MAPSQRDIVCSNFSGKDWGSGSRSPRGHTPMGTSLRSGMALQEVLDPSQDSSWDLPLALGFGEFWETWALKIITGGDSCFFPADKLGSTLAGRETGGGRGCSTALVLRLHPQRQGSGTWCTEKQNLFPNEWGGRALRLPSASHLDPLGCLAFLKWGKIQINWRRNKENAKTEPPSPVPIQYSLCLFPKEVVFLQE